MATYYFVRDYYPWVALIIEINHLASVKRVVVLMPESQHLLCSFLQPCQDVSLLLRYPLYVWLGEQRAAELWLPAARAVPCQHRGDTGYLGKTD